jgi:hypothetical protein
MLRLSRWAAVASVVASAAFGAPVAMAQDEVVGQYVNESWITTPSAGAAAAVGEPVLISGYAMIGEGTGPIKVEITFDGGETWTEADADGYSYWRHLITPVQAGDVTFQVRAWFEYVAEPEYSGVRTLHVGTPAGFRQITCPCKYSPFFFPGLDIDRLPVELGERFSVDRPGRLSGVDITRGAYGGPVTVRVWGPGGVLLHEQAVPATTGSYSYVTFTTPVPVQPDGEYVVSYYTPEGGYRTTEEFFIGTLYSSPFVIPLDAGVFRYGDGGGFPTETWNHSNYHIYPKFVF